MTPDDLEKMLRAATPGPWTDQHPGYDDHEHCIRSIKMDTAVLLPFCYGGEAGIDITSSDMGFILASRVLMPALLRLWRAARTLDDADWHSTEDYTDIEEALRELERLP